MVRLLVTVLLGWAWLLPSGPANAQFCNIQNTANSLEMGTLSSAGASTSGAVNFFCRHFTPEPRTYTICVFMNPQANTPGVEPRMMVNDSVSGPGHSVNFDLYADPGHTQILGSETSMHPLYSTTVHVGAGTEGEPREAAGTLPVYALLPPGQVVAGGDYVSQVDVSLHYTSQAGDVPPEASLCAEGEEQGHFMPVIGTGPTGCAVGIATDLDFGEVSSLASNQDQTSTINLHCPSSTMAWHLKLNDGEHGTGGQRRMTNADGTLFVEYELYRDSSRTQRWGDTDDTDVDGTGTGSVQTVTVYGRTSLQSPTPPPGVYSDTITVTLTF